MKIRSLPTLCTRYWVVMLSASLVGTTLGDFVSTDLHFGFVKGLLPLSFILTAVFVVEWKTKEATEGYYWAAIVLTRTMATNLADLATYSLKLDYAWLEVALFAFLMVTPLFHRPSIDPSIDQSEVINEAATPLSNNGARYWVMVLVASIIGTTLGDLISDNLGLGGASTCLGLICVMVLLLQLRLKFPGSAVYWSILILVRTTGTVWGDFLSGEEGLNLGFMATAAYTTFLLVCVLRLWRPSSSDAISDLSCDNEGETVAISEADQPKLS